MKKVAFLKILIFIVIIVFLGSGQYAYSQTKELTPKPFLKGVWKIVRFWTEPSCYTKLPDRDNTIKINAIFECAGLTPCEDLIIKSYWDSSIEHVVKEINLTEAVITTCGSGATRCTVMWGGDPVDVNLMPRRISISAVGHISPRLTGDIALKLEAFTGTKLTDKKSLIVHPCSRGKPDLVIEKFEMPEVFRAGPDKMADVKIVLWIKNIGSAPAEACDTEVLFKSYPAGSLVYESRASVPALAPGERYQITAFYRLPEGNYQVCAVADAKNVVPESDEANNQSCRPFSVRSR